MRLGTLLLITSTAAAVFAATACQGPAAPTDPDQGNATDGTDPSEEKQRKQSPARNTCLGKANLGFDDAECNKCMSDNAECCAATIACFDGDADCAALHTCVSQCGGTQADAPGTTPQTGNGAQVFASSVYPALSATCASCHATGTSNAPIFFGADAAATYTLFKARGFNRPNSALVTKGQHFGPPMMATARAAVDGWVAAETSTTVTGPGTGTGNGNGNGAGNGTGGTGACREACLAKHPGSATKWQTYNTCTAVTCKAACL